MCQSVGLTQVDRVECSTRYLFTFQSKHDGSGDFKLLSEVNIILNFKISSMLNLTIDFEQHCYNFLFLHYNFIS